MKHRESRLCGYIKVLLTNASIGRIFQSDKGVLNVPANEAGESERRTLDNPPEISQRAAKPSLFTSS
jgi:hypothetical protein